MHFLIKLALLLFLLYALICEFHSLVLCLIAADIFFLLGVCVNIKSRMFSVLHFWYEVWNMHMCVYVLKLVTGLVGLVCLLNRWIVEWFGGFTHIALPDGSKKGALLSVGLINSLLQTIVAYQLAVNGCYRWAIYISKNFLTDKYWFLRLNSRSKFW